MTSSSMKKLSIADIKSGALVGAPVNCTIAVLYKGEPHEIDVLISKYNYNTAIENFKAFGENKDAMAGVIASCIVDEEGNRQFTEDDVRKYFNDELTKAVWSKIYAINHPEVEQIESEEDDEAGKPVSKSRKTTKRGLSSSATVSVEVPSPMPKET